MKITFDNIDKQFLDFLKEKYNNVSIEKILKSIEEYYTGKEQPDNKSKL